jgi:hypothetical protein
MHSASLRRIFPTKSESRFAGLANILSILSFVRNHANKCDYSSGAYFKDSIVGVPHIFIQKHAKLYCYGTSS